jgi:hypothetical protein
MRDSVARLVVSMMVLFVVGMMIGVTITIATYDPLSSMPNCEEDEYLYPLDYEGPGDNEPSEYSCWHFDDTYHD